MRVAALTASSVTVTANASANTKGSYAELSSSTPFDGFVQLLAQQTTSTHTARRCAVDIAIGAASSEQIILPDLLMEWGQDEPTNQPILFPMPIPAGTRVAARMQANTGSTTLQITAHLLAASSGAVPRATWATQYGVTTSAATQGTQVDPGGSAGTKGAYSEITASCNAIRWLLVQVGNQGNNAETRAAGNWDLAIGAGGSEQIVLPDIRFFVGQAANSKLPRWMPFHLLIPSGTRLAIRAQTSITDATDRLMNFAVLGMS